jgi:hypothetical protein
MIPRDHYRGAVLLFLLLLLSRPTLGSEADPPEPTGNPLAVSTNSNPVKGATNSTGPYNSYLPEENEHAPISSFGAEYDKSEFSWMMSAEIRHAATFGGDIKRLTHITLTPLAIEEEEFSLGLFVGAANVEYDSGSGPDLLTDDPWMLEAGLAARAYFNKSRNGLSPYLGFSLAYQLLVWDYRTPVIVNGNTYDNNALSGVEGTVSVGITTLRDNYVAVFGEVGVGGTVFICNTWQGFRNDLFNDFGFMFVKAGITFKF